MLFSALALLAAPVAALPSGSDSFVDAKSGYRVDVSHDGDTMLLDGVNPKTHARFHLKVARGGHVTGVFAGAPVNYVMPAGAPGAEQLASNAR